jgi:hypothetical protein
MDIFERERPASDDALRQPGSAANSGATGTESPFGSPAPKPMPLWLFVGGAMALLVVANLVHGPASPEAPGARPPAAAPRRLTESRAAVPTGAISLEQELPGAISVPERAVKCLAGGRVAYPDRAACRGTANGLASTGSPAMGIVGPSDYAQELLASAAARIETRRFDEATACAALDRDILVLDAAARSARSAYERNVLRDARARARSRRGSLGC